MRFAPKARDPIRRRDPPQSDSLEGATCTLLTRNWARILRGVGTHPGSGTVPLEFLV
jgi:hypothetical protein